ncbi:MAG TPA: FkbM family methyltransferase [Terriglobales bacterium]|nr:FkbM family methyltransferase [Terriglobales bacterium]
MRDFYGMARRKFHRRRIARAATSYFVNIDEYREALELEDGRVVEIRTKDGLTVAIRRNYMDAAILAEIFLDHCYVEGLSLPERPVIVDIGGYIGDFALYAVMHLNARKVVVCEPSPHNWVLLQENVVQNRFQDRIKLVNKAVTNGEDVMMNVDAPGRGQARVTAYGPNNLQRKAIPGVTLAALVEEYGLTTIDLLKIDCEGGEYDILSHAPAEVLRRVSNLVFEYHEIDEFESKLKIVNQRLRDQGYSLTTRGSLISATRR